jgi:hypothetical protein
MTDQAQTHSKQKQLAPNWKHFFWRYVAGILLIPVFGLGLVLIWWVRRTQAQFLYTITDDAIQVQDKVYAERVDLENIKQVNVQQRWIDKQTGMGTIELITDGRKLELFGQPNPHQLADTLKEAIAYRRELLKKQQKTKPEKEMPKAGEIERMNYLTGLWQQGLITDEEYQRQQSS